MNTGIDAELHALRMDAERYRWLKKTNPMAVAAIAYVSPAACEVHAELDNSFDRLDDAVDAARKELP